MTTKYRGTHGMIVVIKKEKLVFLMMCSPQVKVGLPGFIVGWKKKKKKKKSPDIWKFIETPKYVRICDSEIKLIL